MRPPSGRFVVEHTLPGRLRLRLPRDADLERLTQALGARPGVAAAIGSPVTGGVLVRFDPARIDTGALLDVLASHSLEALAPEGAPSSGTLAEAVTGALRSLDAKVKGSTRSAVGLGTLLPLGLVAWAAGEIARGRGTPLAWSSALWYAHGVFRDYNREATRDAPPPADSPSP